MIIEIPNENSIVKWKNEDKDEWKVAEISDLIKAYERPQGKLIDIGNTGACNFCSVCEEFILSTHYYFCPNCGADMRGEKE